MARKSSWETSLLTLVSKGRIFPSSREQKRPTGGGYSPHFSYSKAPLMLPRGPLRMHQHQQVSSETPEAGRPWLEYQPPKASYLTLRALPSLKKRSNSFESLNEIIQFKKKKTVLVFSILYVSIVFQKYFVNSKETSR